MKNFRWNIIPPESKAFWDKENDCLDVCSQLSDKQILQYPNAPLRYVLFALCRVVLDLIEIEEARNEKSSH